MALTRQLNAPADYPTDTVVTLNSEGRPLSCIYDMVWDFSAMQATGNGKSARVSFTQTSEQYRRQIQATVYEYMQQQRTKNKQYPSYMQLTRYRQGLVYITEFMESANWALLSNENAWKQLKKALEVKVRKGHLGQISCQKILTAINILNGLGYCDRLIQFKDLGVSNLVGVCEQAIAIPVSMYTTLLRNAIATLEKYHPHRHAISTVMEEAYRVAEITRAQAVLDGCTTKKIRTLVSSAMRKITHEIPDFSVKLDGAQLSKIHTHCGMVILAFSGVRTGELISFNKDSYQIKEGVPVLQGETTKGADGRPRVVTWQTHPIAKDALELAYDMLEFMRPILRKKIYGGQLNVSALSKSLKEIESAFLSFNSHKAHKSFVSRSISTRLSKHYKKNVIAHLEDVEEFDRLNPSRRGSLVAGQGLPRLSAHDFRRTFAVFFKRFGFGSSNTIKYQYKQKNIQMADYYANNARLQAMEDILLDNDLLQLMHEEGIQMGVDIFDEIYNESGVLSGEEGKRIAEDKFQKLRGGHQIYMTRDEIESLLRNGTLSVVKLPTGGYCTNSECSRLCGLQEFAADKKPCTFKVVTDKEAKTILRQNKRLITTFRGMNTGDRLNHSILVGLKQKIQLNELTLIEHKINFEPFTDKVEGLIKTEVA